MQISQWLFFALYFGALAFGVIYPLWMLNFLSDAFIEHKLRQRFLRDLRGAVEFSQPSWERLVEIAQSRGLTQRSAYVVVRNLLRDILVGAEPKYASYRQLLEDYAAKYKLAEPFEGLPSETRVHLERLQESLGTNTLALEPLVSQIKELFSVYEKDKRRQRFYTVWGFFIGVIGLLFAGYTYFFPYTAQQDTKAAATQSQGAK